MTRTDRFAYLTTPVDDRTRAKIRRANRRERKLQDKRKVNRG